MRNLKPTPSHMLSSQSRFTLKDNPITSMQQCQSRIESRIVIGGGSRIQTEDLIRQKDDEYNSIDQWIDIYRRSNSSAYFRINTVDNNPLEKYEINSQNYRYFKLHLKKLNNLQIDPKSFTIASKNLGSSNKSAVKTQFFVQFSLEFVNLDCNQLIKSIIYSSEYMKLQHSHLRQRYIVDQEKEMYFFFNKSYKNIGILVKFFIVLCEKNKFFNCVVDKYSFGAFSIDLNDNWSEEVMINKNLDQYFQYSSQQRKQQFNAKIDEYAQIKLIESPSDQLPILSSILCPFKVYTAQTKLIYLKSKHFPASLSNYQVRYSTRPYNMNFQLTQLWIPDSQLMTIMINYEKMIRFKYHQIVKIQSTQIKEYRMVVLCHNGEKIISTVNCMLKKGQRGKNIAQNNRGYGKNQQNRKQQTETLENKKSASKQKQNNKKRQNTKQDEYFEKNNTNKFSSENHLLLVNDGVANLDLAFDAEGVIILSQIFCRVEMRIQLHESSKSISQSAIFPISYLLKPMTSIQNDVKYIEPLYMGQFLSQKGVHSYLQQQRQRQQHNEKFSKIKTNQFSSLSRVTSKAEKMSQSTIQFYVFKQTKEDALKNYSTMMQESHLNHKDQNMSVSFAQQNNGNQINRLLMEKARIQRERQKMKQKIHRLNIEHNRTIPLLDTTELKMKIYQEKITKMKQDRYELKSTLDFLKTKVDEFEQKQNIKKQLIEDTLKQIFTKDAAPMQTGHRFVNAKGGQAARIQQSFNQLEQISKKMNFLKVSIPQNPDQFSFPLNLSNLTKIMNFLKQNKSIQILLEGFQYFTDIKIKTFQVYGGFENFSKMQNSAEIMRPQQNNQSLLMNNLKMKFGLDLPNYLTSNLLATFLFSPFCLYIVNNETNIQIGNCYFYLSKICNMIIQSTNNPDFDKEFSLQAHKTYIWNGSSIVGKLNLTFKVMKNCSHALLAQKSKDLPLKTGLISQIQNKLILTNQPEQKRKLMRIQNFKKKQQARMQEHNGIKLLSAELQKQKNIQKHQRKFEPLSGEQQNLIYHSMNSSIVKVALSNSTSERKIYSASINDPDKKYYGQQNQFQAEQNQLGMVYDPQFLQKDEKLLNLDSQTQKMYLQPHDKGVMVFSYSSERRLFFQRLNQQLLLRNIYPTKQNIQQAFLSQHNHPHTITTTITSSTGVQKIFHLQVTPQRDFNTICIPLYLQAQEQFYLPLPSSKHIRRNNLYFKQKSIQLLQNEENQLFLTGEAPQLNKVLFFEVLCYPDPQNFTTLMHEYCEGTQLTNFYNKQIVRQLISTEKMLNLSFQLWGCILAKTVESRLFQRIDILWEVNYDHLYANQGDQTEQKSLPPSIKPHYIYACSSNVDNIGFRSTKFPDKIQASKKITLNNIQNSAKTLVKSVVKSSLIGQTTVLVQIQDSLKRDIILCRYLFTLVTRQPHLFEQVSFQIELKKLQIMLDQQQNAKTPLIDRQSLKESFLVDIQPLLIDFNHQKQKASIQQVLQKSIKFHSSQIFLKLSKIQLVHNQEQIDKYISQRQRKQSSLNIEEQKPKDPRMEVPKKQSQRQLKLKSQKEAGKRRTSKQRQRQNEKNTQQKNSLKNKTVFIARLHLQINEQLLCQHFRSKNISSVQELTPPQKDTKKSKKKPLSLFQTLLISNIYDFQNQQQSSEPSSKFTSCIFALEHNEVILNYGLSLIQKKQQANEKMKLIEQILRKNHLNGKEKSSNDRENDMKKKRQGRKSSDSEDKKITNFFFNQS